MIIILAIVVVAIGIIIYFYYQNKEIPPDQIAKMTPEEFHKIPPIVISKFLLPHIAAIRPDQLSYV